MSRAHIAPTPRVPVRVRAAAERVLKACVPVVADAQKAVSLLRSKAKIEDLPIEELEEARGALMDLAAALGAR